MALELSADTYDWGRFHDRGHALVDLLETVHEQQTWDSPAAARASLEAAVETAWDSDIEASPFVLIVGGPDDNPVKFELNLPYEDWNVYEFSLDIDLKRERSTATLKANSDFDDLRVLHSGPLADADFECLRDHIDYLFEALRRVHTVHTNTLLSEREREVAVLRNMGYEDEDIIDLMQITQSNLTQYDKRIERHRREAEATLNLLAE